MKTILFKLIALPLLILIFSIPARAEDLRKIATLSGEWKFSIGDDPDWAMPAFNDSGWDRIRVPGQWEDQGYRDYNGFAWYRRSFNVVNTPDNNTIYLILGRIDDVDAVYINGKEIGRSGKFPPYYVTAYDKVRRYIVPVEYLKENAENIIAVRVYDSYNDGGIVSGSPGMYIDEDIDLLDLNFNGKWKFQTGNNREWKSADLNDDNWKSINVPSAWENEGYDDYDGYAWYRFKFSLPRNFSAGEFYLSLGKIDDTDDVFLNGENIGNVYDLKKDSEYRMRGWEYNARRVYKIREGLLNRTGINTIAIKVYDEQGVGGIYEGPIGIMSSENYQRYKSKYHSSQSFWDYLQEKLFFYEN
jgi:sialate O-acetylesterase